MEVFEAMFHGDRTGRLGGRITVPTTETTDDPCRPSEAVGRMRILAPFALGPAVLVQRGERCDLVCAERELRRLLAAAVACLQELDGDDRRFGRNGDEL